MESYSYVVINKSGKEIKGSMEAANDEKVKASLKSEGHIVLSIEKQNALNKDINLSFGKLVKPRDLCVFCRQFVSILSAGVSITNALDMLHQQAENKAMGNALREIQISVEKGETLADAMRIHKKIFPPILTNMVQAGEASGDLEVVFERMATHFEKDTKLKAQMKKAMIYPIIVGLVAVAVITIMMVVVIPNFMVMFEDMNIEMPFMTQLVINMSHFMTTKWYLIVGFLLILVIGVNLYKKSPTGQGTIGKLAFTLPFFGSLNKKSNSARFARTLSTLLAAGISMIDAIEITSRAMDNVVVKEVLLEAAQDVSKGVPLSHPIKNASFFPPMVYQMIKIGEESGNIESMLEKVADYYDDEVEIATEALTAIIEPLIIVFLALVVGVIIMAIMQPMLAMYNGLDQL